MAISNFSELKTSIADWLNRSDLTARIPDFITLTEAELNRRLRVNNMLKTITYSTHESKYALPTDWLEHRRAVITVNGRRRLVEVVSDEQAEVLAAERPTTGAPEFMTFSGNDIWVVPTSDGLYPWEMTYYYRIPTLTDAAPTNLLLTANPDLYLYGALQHSAPFLQHDERLGVWSAKFQAILAELGAQDDRAIFSTATPRVRSKVLG